ncbi:MAG: LysR family transcriptional regulator [Eubacteriales bacterium]|nr:LysR family transcriptional regulator [Eubacteriales bacterium]
MDVQKLDYFLTAADIGNFTQAADQCKIAQTTMSKYIAQLENEFNCKLFYRTNKGCELTDQGHIFYEKALSMKRDYFDLVSALQQDHSRDLNLGLDGSHFYVSIFTDFQSHYPEIKLNASFGSEKELVDDLVHQRLHAIVMPDSINRKIKGYPEIKSVDILKALEYLVFPPNTVKHFGSIPEAIRNLPFITKSIDNEYYDFCRSKLHTKFGTTFHEVRVARSQDVQNMLLALSQGFAIIPLSEMDDDTDFECFPLGDDFVEMLQLFYSTKYMNEPLRKLIEFINAHGVVNY